MAMVTKAAPSDEDLNELRERALHIRRTVIEMLGRSGSGHPGGSLSAADLMAALFLRVLRIDAQNPAWEDRDRFILSKGHAAPVLYAALAEAGLLAREELWTHRKLGSRLQGHPSHRDLPWVEVSTGSLGQGLSAGIGMALAARLDRRPSRVFVLLGDGELDEGQVWEAALSAARWQLGNLIAIIDANGFQLDGAVEDILPLGDIAQKWNAFGWQVCEMDGHDMSQVVAALCWATGIHRSDRDPSRPAAIIARTTKGRGVSFMEANNDYHAKPLTEDEVRRALAELEG